MLNIVVPMAGRGSRFLAARHARPKPLIEVEPGRPMIDYVIEFLRGAGPNRFHFVCRAEDVAAFDLRGFFASRVGPHAIVETPGLTRGPACSALLAVHALPPGDELLVAYCDSYLKIDLRRYLAFCRSSAADGVILTYPSADPSCAYARIDAAGRVLATAEKDRIGPSAMAGQYYFRRIADFVGAARRMVDLGHSVNGEFFVSTVYNEMIAAGAKVLAYPIDAGDEVELGTPEDLARFRAGGAEARSRRQGEG